jgi:hypothetical protein
MRNKSDFYNYAENILKPICAKVKVVFHLILALSVSLI